MADAQDLSESYEVNNNNSTTAKSSSYTTANNLSVIPTELMPRSPISFNLSPTTNNPNVVSSTFPNIQNLDEGVQEKFVVQELINVLSGVNSSLIVCYNVSPQKILFNIDPRVPDPMGSLAMAVTPLAGYYYTVNRYMEEVFDESKDGRVLQALVSFIEDYMQEYFILLAQLDAEFRKKKLSLQELTFYTSPTLLKMQAISSVLIEIETKKLKGGTVLSCLFDKAVSTAGTMDEICLTMATKASVPYFQTLENWIYKGTVRDRYSEFFFTDLPKEDEIATNMDDFWDKQYKPVADRCPNFLVNWLDQIVKAGKYLNVVKQCGHEIGPFEGEKIVFSIHKRDYEKKIEKAYLYASKKLLTLMMEEYDLINHLRSIKHYFLMDKGDLISKFMQVAENELSKPVGQVNPVRVESLMALALRTSSSCSDKYKNCLKIQLSPYTISDELLKLVSKGTDHEHSYNENFEIPGIQGFSLSYEVKWPISLVLTRHNLLIYQLIFRHMFLCKHVERRLNEIWIHYKDSPPNKTEDQQKGRVTVFALRQKMLEFVQNLMYYMTFEVIEPAWESLLESIKKASNVDDVIKCHNEFAQGLLEDSMLATKALVEPMSNMMNICLRFSKKMMLLYHQNAKHNDILDRLAVADKAFTGFLLKFLKEASHIVGHSQEFEKKLKIGNMITRLNFNGYYSESLDSTPKKVQESCQKT